MSLNISGSHSRSYWSLEVTPLSRACVSPYKYFIATMALSRTVSEIFSIRYWHDLKIWVRGHSRSLKMVPFHRSHTSSYSSSVVTMAISCIILEIRTKATNYQLFDIGRKVPIFIARQHTDARYWYSKSVRPSVRPSVTFRYCMKTA